MSRPPSNRRKAAADPAKDESRVLARTCIVAASAVLVGCIITWLSITGLHMNGGEWLATFGLIGLSFVPLAVITVLPTGFAVMFLRHHMRRSRWRAVALMSGIALLWAAIISLVMRAFLDLGTYRDLLVWSLPGIGVTAAALIAAAPWIVHDPSRAGLRPDHGLRPARTRQRRR